jgi:hypothetical protein
VRLTTGELPPSGNDELFLDPRTTNDSLGRTARDTNEDPVQGGDTNT